MRIKKNTTIIADSLSGSVAALLEIIEDVTNLPMKTAEDASRVFLEYNWDDGFIVEWDYEETPEEERERLEAEQVWATREAARQVRLDLQHLHELSKQYPAVAKKFVEENAEA